MRRSVFSFLKVGGSVVHCDEESKPTLLEAVRSFLHFISLFHFIANFIVYTSFSSLGRLRTSEWHQKSSHTSSLWWFCWGETSSMHVLIFTAVCVWLITLDFSTLLLSRLPDKVLCTPSTGCVFKFKSKWIWIQLCRICKSILIAPEIAILVRKVCLQFHPVHLLFCSFWLGSQAVGQPIYQYSLILVDDQDKMLKVSTDGDFNLETDGKLVLGCEGRLVGNFNAVVCETVESEVTWSNVMCCANDIRVV